MTSQKNWMLRHPILTLVGIFLVFLFIQSLYSDTPAPNLSRNVPTRSAQTQSRSTVDRNSPAYKLASLQVGKEPSSSLVSQFDTVLSLLSAKCPSDSKSRLGDYIYIGWEKLNGSLTLLETAKGINGSIPLEAAGTLNCAEVAAAFVTLSSQ